MDSVIDPSADVLWESVSTTIDRAGQTDHMPRTDEDWKTVRRSAVSLVEATNLLVIGPRRVAPAGDKSEYPGIELMPVSRLPSCGWTDMCRNEYPGRRVQRRAGVQWKKTSAP